MSAAAVSLQNLAARPPALRPSTHAGLLLQRKCACGRQTASLTGECAACRSRKRLQTQLAIGASNDPLEQEADRVADQVLAAPAHPAVAVAKPQVQRFAGPPIASADTAPASVERVLAAPGVAMAPALRQDMERRFGHDFSKVRVHADAAAEQSARDVNAAAYTVGHDIVFGAGRFVPETHEGRGLLAHELTHVVQQNASEAMLQRQSTTNVLRHSGRWTDIDSPTVLGLWAKEAAINKLWLESTLQEVQEYPERVSELVDAVLPKLRALLYSSREFSGSLEARKDADEALQMRWPLPGAHGIRDQVLDEFVRRYTKQLEQALAHTPEGTELITAAEEIRRVRHQPYDGIWWHRIEFIHKGQISPPREILDIKACPKGSEDRCAKGDPLRDIWFILKRDPNWIYFSRDQRIDRFDWTLNAVAGQVAESTQFAAELFPYLLKLAGFSLGLSSRLAFILGGEILSALGEQGARAARGEKMQSAREVVEGIGFGVITAYFLGRLFHRSPGPPLKQNLDEAIETAAARARVEVARTDASLVERELRAGRARAVEHPELVADGYRIEVDVISEGQQHTWRLNANGSWCRFTEALCVRQLGDAVDEAARQHPPIIEGEAEMGSGRATSPRSTPLTPPKKIPGYRPPSKFSEKISTAKVMEAHFPAHDWEHQPVFLQGERVPRAKGKNPLLSTEPDWYSKSLNTAVEVKNKDFVQRLQSVDWGAINLQLEQRIHSLPAGTKNWIIFDVRKQPLSTIEQIASKLSSKWNGVFFITDDGLSQLIP